MIGKFKINADRVLDAVDKIDKSKRRIQDAKDILSEIDIPSDFKYESKLINYKGTMSTVIDDITHFNNWLEHQVESYKGITCPVTTSQHGKIVVQYQKMYLRETESGVEYTSPKSVDEVKADWENLPGPLKIASRLVDSFEVAIASFITIPVRIVFLIGTILPGSIGEGSAKNLKEINMAEYKELITDMSGSNYMSDGFVRDIVDASGNIVGKVTIYFTIVGGVGELAELGMIAHYETVKDGVAMTYEFVENMGDVATYAYSNGDIDLSDDSTRREIFANAVQVAMNNTAINMVINDVIDEHFAKEIILTTSDKIKSFIIKGTLGAADQTLETTITTAYKAKMTNQEFLDMINEINPAEIALYSFVYSPITNTMNIYKDSKPCAQIELTD